MNNRIWAALALTPMLSGISEPAASASLGLAIEAPSVTASSAFIDYLEFGGFGDLSTFGGPVDATDGIGPTGVAEIGFGVGFDPADPVGTATGGLDIFDDDGLFLAGNLTAVGFTEDVIELQFTDLIGSESGSFGSSVLALISFDDPLGPNPFASLLDGDSLEASITVSAISDTTGTVVPLPATLPLLLLGLAVTGLVSRGRARSQS